MSVVSDIVDLDDQVAGQDAGAECGRVLDRGHDAHHAVLDAHVDAESAELALGVDLKLLELVGVEEIGMRVEPVHHPDDRPLDELFVGYRLDVVALDPAEDRGQELEIVVRNGCLVLVLRDRRKIQRQQNAENGTQPDQSRLFPATHHCNLPFPATAQDAGAARQRPPGESEGTAPESRHSPVSDAQSGAKFPGGCGGRMHAHGHGAKRTAVSHAVPQSVERQEQVSEASEVSEKLARRRRRPSDRSVAEHSTGEPTTNRLEIRMKKIPISASHYSSRKGRGAIRSREHYEIACTIRHAG